MAQTTTNIQENPITMKADGFKVAGQQYKDIFYALRRIELMDRDEERKAVEELRHVLLEDESQPWVGYNAWYLWGYMEDSKKMLLYDGIAKFAQDVLWQRLETLAKSWAERSEAYISSKKRIEERWGEWETHEFLRRAPGDQRYLSCLVKLCLKRTADSAKRLINRELCSHARLNRTEDRRYIFKHELQFIRDVLIRPNFKQLEDSHLESVGGIIDSDGFLVYDEIKDSRKKYTLTKNETDQVFSLASSKRGGKSPNALAILQHIHPKPMKYKRGVLDATKDAIARSDATDWLGRPVQELIWSYINETNNSDLFDDKALLVFAYESWKIIEQSAHKAVAKRLSSWSSEAFQAMGSHLKPGITADSVLKIHKITKKVDFKPAKQLSNRLIIERVKSQAHPITLDDIYISTKDLESILEIVCSFGNAQVLELEPLSSEELTRINASYDGDGFLKFEDHSNGTASKNGGLTEALPIDRDVENHHPQTGEVSDDERDEINQGFTPMNGLKTESDRTPTTADQEAVKEEPVGEGEDIDIYEDAPIHVNENQDTDNLRQNGTGSTENGATRGSPEDEETEEGQSNYSDQDQEDQEDQDNNDDYGSNDNGDGDGDPADNDQARHHRQCLPCRYRHASCDKGQPVCSKCIKHYGKDNRTHLCTYYYPSLTMPVVVPEEYKVRVIVRRRRRPKLNLSVTTRSDEVQPGATRSATKSAPPAATSGSATSPGLNQQGNWKRWQRLQIERLKGTLMHCLERDAKIKLTIAQTEYDFLSSTFARNNGFATVAPEEFLELFDTKIWRWKRQIMSAIPIMIKDGIICFVKAGEEKNKQIPFFIRDYYLREADKDKDGWEDLLGPKPLMEDMRVQQLMSQGIDVTTARVEKSPATAGKKRTRKPRKSVFGGIEALDDERRRKNPRTENRGSSSGAWPTANNATQEYNSDDTDEDIIPPAFSASQPRPTAFSTTFRPHSTHRVTAPTEPTRLPSQTPSQSHTPSATAEPSGPRSVKDIIEGLKNDITDLQRLANSTTNALIKETAKDECERLKMQCVEMKEWEAAEREIEVTPGLSDAVRKMMTDALVKKALARKAA